MEFTEEEIELDPILRYFEYNHLPNTLQRISEIYSNTARISLDQIPRCAERTVMFRKLLEAKDCAVRAML